MQNFTPEELQPHKSTILFIKQFARMYNNMKSAEGNSSAVCLN